MQPVGIEPGTPAWKACVFNLSANPIPTDTQAYSDFSRLMWDKVTEARIWSLHREKKKENRKISWVGSESKVPVNLEQIKIVGRKNMEAGREFKFLKVMGLRS